MVQILERKNNEFDNCKKGKDDKKFIGGGRKIGAIVVTFNRLEKLEKALISYETQTLPPRYIIVVDNASGDGTAEFLDVWQKKPAAFDKYVIHLPENRGGSGGFYVGQEKALSLDAEWVMLADDDAYPESDYIEGMQSYIDKYKAKKEEISALAGKVCRQGMIQSGHRYQMRSLVFPTFGKALSEGDYKKEVVEVDGITYVGIVINVNKLRKAGLVLRDYFIWHDDTEHCIRLQKEGKLLCIPKFTIIHDCDAENTELSWKTYYGWRNQVDMRRRHSSIQFILGTVLLLGKTCLLFLKGKGWTEMRIRFMGIWDGILGKLGLHEKYRPGWKP